MTEEIVIALAQRALLTVLMVSVPMLGSGLIVGLVVSILQATTQIQEQTLTFVPKIIAVLGSIIIFGSWILSTMIQFTYNLYSNINSFIY
ncbi:MAG TPA: flagellar biosynthesis protein FliQ [Thermoanaerobacterales bacterium]|nr:flagellar biosynthesis protein FliQ [Thermoanaerobacterales bacterium]